MKKLTLEPLGESALVSTGSPLLSALLAKNLKVLMSCGGRGICSTCHVKISEGIEHLSPMQPKESRTLKLVVDSTPESRLACQAHVYGDGIVVQVPDGMYIEKADDLLSLLGTPAPQNILHPITGALLIPKGKLITRTLFEQSRWVEADLAKLREVNDTDHSTTKSHFCASGVAMRPKLTNTTKIVQKTAVTTPLPSQLESRRNEAPRNDSSLNAITPEPHSTPIDKKIPAISSARETSSLTHSKVYANNSRLQPTIRVNCDPGITPQSPAFMNDTVRAGAQIDKYLLLEQVGQGGAGVVYRALHTKLKILVAVKFLRPDITNIGQETLVREAQLLAQLSHPNVVRVIDFEDHPQRPYVVMEFVDGLTASDLVKQSGRIAPKRAIEIGLDVAAGLEAAWALGIVHRDVKLGNILVTRNGHSKLVDLGLAVFGNDTLTQSPGGNAIEGTVGYMAPEAISGQAVDHRSDMYSLGASLFHMLSGRLPFIGRSFNEVALQHMQKPPPNLHELIPEIPASVAALILRLMEKNPDRRFDDYADLIAELKHLKRDLEDSTAVVRGIR
jgi:ferredoxin/tRNA A-37 threonylcarbamoyl transferase component Bud32